MLTAFKNALFDSEELDDNQFVPLKVFKELQEYEMYDLLAPFMKKLLEEIVDKKRNQIDMQKFNDLCDLFFYLPDKQRPN